MLLTSLLMNYIVGIFAILVNKDKSLFSKESVSVQDAQLKELTKKGEKASGSMSKLGQSMSE
jgi:hypothetical protein